MESSSSASLNSSIEILDMHEEELNGTSVTNTTDDEEFLAVRLKNRELEQKVSAAEEKFKEMERKNEDVIKINQVCMMIFCQMFKKSPLCLGFFLCNMHFQELVDKVKALEKVAQGQKSQENQRRAEMNQMAQLSTMSKMLAELKEIKVESLKQSLFAQEIHQETTKQSNDIQAINTESAKQVCMKILHM